MSPASALLELSAVTKRFGGLTAVDGVSFAVPEHTVHGVIGPNGAGKSTLVNMISGAIRPTSGHIRFGEGVCRAARWDAPSARDAGGRGCGLRRDGPGHR